MAADAGFPFFPAGNLAKQEGVSECSAFVYGIVRVTVQSKCTLLVMLSDMKVG